MRTVHGVVQHYAWGDPTFIPRLLDVEPDGVEARAGVLHREREPHVAETDDGDDRVVRPDPLDDPASVCHDGQR